MLTVGTLTIDSAGRVVRCDGERLTLRAKEFDLLAAFAANAGLALSRKQILLDVWGYDVPGQTRTVDVHVNHLRRRLAGTGVAIETLRGVGYRLVAGPPTAAAGQAPAPGPFPNPGGGEPSLHGDSSFPLGKGVGG